jgi:hypothetical protein
MAQRFAALPHSIFLVLSVIAIAKDLPSSQKIVDA